MAKAFFDVFPGLKLDGKLKSLFEQTQIERVTATKQKDFVRIYLSSERADTEGLIFLRWKVKLRSSCLPAAISP